MGNASSHQPIASSASTSTSTSTSQSSSNSSTKSPKLFHIHSNPFSHHSHSTDGPRTSSIDEHGALLKGVKDIQEDGDGTYLLRRGSFESREDWLARKQIIALRIKGDSNSGAGVMMWKDYTIDGGKGQL
ncbi:hypothetical protein SBOR_4561 [Sclerotinia borealis F-4128]|uniref:Uncharacterized protein n=1 Tax=Sclerotinia borealis (strain F-4128) TaxID=1432307 RepID=W9CGF4_SCLBF|nr:hypothetical protein SBOR_4561 [Sclerotinia borealis F-4128]